MKFLQDLGSKIATQDPNTLEKTETVFGLFVYVALGAVFGMFVQPYWFAIVLSVVFPILLGIKSAMGKIAAEQNATIRTTKLFTSMMTAMFAPKVGAQLGNPAGKPEEPQAEKEMDDD